MRAVSAAGRRLDATFSLLFSSALIPKLFPAYQQQFRIGTHHVVDGILEGATGVNGSLDLFDEIGGYVHDSFFPIIHERQRPVGMPLPGETMAGWFSAANGAFRQGSWKDVIRNRVQAERIEFFLAPVSGRWAFGSLFHLVVILL